MRVLLVNKFYYPRGGDCVVTMATERLLRDHGHEVAVFAMQYPDNVATQWQRHFAPQVAFDGGAGDKLRAVRRMLGRDTVGECFTRLLDEFWPEVVHLHNIHSYLSPVVARIARERGCRVVWTMHDYKLVCPSYSMLADGKPCRRCLAGGPRGVLATRCMKGSLAASAMAWLEATAWSREKLSQWVDAFICPSRFMRQTMIDGGFDPARLHVVNNSVDDAKREALLKGAGTPREDYCCYVGRLSHEKGVDTMLRALADEPSLTVKVAGGGPLEDELRRRYGSLPNVQFLGHLDAAGVTTLLSKAKFSVVPSEWFENNPLSVIESLCAGTPVVGADIGGIPELLDDTNGLTFESGNAAALLDAARMARLHRWDTAAIATAATKRFDPETHYGKLIEIYSGGEASTSPS